MGWVKDIEEILAPLTIIASLAIVETEEGQDGNKGPVWIVEHHRNGGSHGWVDLDAQTKEQKSQDHVRKSSESRLIAKDIAKQH